MEVEVFKGGSLVHFPKHTLLILEYWVSVRITESFSGSYCPGNAIISKAILSQWLSGFILRIQKMKFIDYRG